MNAIDALNLHFATEMNAVNDLIKLRMQSQNAPRIPEITAHLTDAGGKRIRPLLTLAAASLCNYQGDKHIKLATTVEFIHTATLLHDDVVDESLKRRGKPTANLLWDNKSSVLVGDYLFSRAFQLMVETENLKVLEILANASAVIAEGEVLQLTVASDIETSEETYFKVIEGKTAALFAAACEVGGVISNAPEAQTQLLRNYGLNLGLAFQITDDVLDYIADENFGKAIGNDFLERKLTLPVIRAIAAGKGEEKAFWHKTISRGQQDDDDLRTALGLLKSHDTLNSSKATALELSQIARAQLASFPQSPLLDHLNALCDLVVSRLV